MRTAGTAAATTPSSCARSRSRPHPARASSHRSRQSGPRCSRTRSISCSGTARAYPSLHVLFATQAEAHECAGRGMLLRSGVQFHWENPGYARFDDFLAAFNHDKRKKVKQDRRKLVAAGVTFTRTTGAGITAADWDFFYRCYRNTYAAHGSTPYLSREFFHAIGAAMPEHLLLVQGWREGRRVCAALDVFDAETMWGRYWGAAEYLPGLHFEACYYQAIEFCIERRLARFEGGAQGVHKLARGLLPVTTWSAHAIGDPDFRRAIADFCARERLQVARSVEELETSSPFRSADATEGESQPSGLDLP